MNDSSINYLPQWESLRKHQTPTWLADAKFGIYSHWGLASVHNYLLKKNPEATLREAIPQFKASKFDADEWADLYKSAGAQFAGPTAWHGHGYVNWKSSITEWNSVSKGPGIDFVGALGKAIRKQGMKFFTSFHTGYWYTFPHWDKNTDEYTNPEYCGLYGPIHDTDAIGDMSFSAKFEKQEKMSDEFMIRVFSMLKEAVDNYQPDVVWYDCGFGGTLRAHNKHIYEGGRLVARDENYLGGFRERYRQDFLAHYFNQAKEWNQEVEFVYKVYDLPPGVGMRNMENGNLGELQYDVWMTDFDLCKPTSWFYDEGIAFKSPEYIINLLADVVSKNGIIVLNVPPQMDGSFADEAVTSLEGIGKWLSVNGEAIYGTMPWMIYGEGPTDIPTGHYSDRYGETHFTPDDFRFTQKGNDIYAICLGIPASTINIRSLGTRSTLIEGDIASVEMLGFGGKLKWEHKPESLKIRVPESVRFTATPVFKIKRS